MPPPRLDLGDPLADQVFAHWLAVEILHQRHELLIAHRRNPIQHGIGIVVAALHPFQVQDSQGALPAELHRHRHIHHAIHGTGDDRDLPSDAAQAPAAVGYGGINCATPRHQGDLVDAVGPANGTGATELNIHLEITGSGQAINRRAANCLVLSGFSPGRERISSAC